MKKSVIISTLIVILTIALCGFTSCSVFDEDEVVPGDGSGHAVQEEDEEEEEDTDFDHPEYDNEQDGATVKEKKKPEDAFYGSWTAKSDHAEFLYGNIDLTIQKGGTWIGNITEEKFNGQWKYNGTGITISSEFVNADLFFADDGVLMFRDHDSPEALIALFPKK